VVGVKESRLSVAFWDSLSASELPQEWCFRSMLKQMALSVTTILHY